MNTTRDPSNALRDPDSIMSSYVNSVDSGVARSAGVSEVLRKPLNSRNIAEALAR